MAFWKDLDKTITTLVEIRRQIVEANMLLCVRVVKKNHFLDSSLTFIDLMQEASIGLMKAVEKFDLSHGTRFGTYAGWWIMQMVRRSRDDKSNMIRLPSYAKDASFRIKKAIDEMTQSWGRAPSIIEISDATGLTESRIIELINASKSTVSVDAPVQSDASRMSDDPGSTMLELTEDTEQLTPERETIEKLQNENISSLLRKLSARHSLVLQLRYGIVDGEECTLGEIGQRLLLSRERVRQLEIEAKAIIKSRLKGVSFQDLF